MSNIAALNLYKEVLGYKVHGIDKSYYADKEDAYDMRLSFEQPKADEPVMQPE